MNLTTTKTRSDATTTALKLSGEIDEFTRIAAVLAMIDTPRVVLDLSDVRRINSSGVREWMNLMMELHRKGLEVTLEACSPAIVSQLNKITNFAASAKVKSVLAPYVCDACVREHHVLVPVEPDVRIATTLACPECGQPSSFDDLAENFLDFAFKPSLPAPPSDRA